MRGVWVHGALALGGLVLAWMAWTQEETEEISPDAVEVMECDSGLKSVELSTKHRSAKVEARGQGDDRYFWVTVENRPEGRDPSKRAFVGSDAVAELAKKFEPFRAVRSLGQVKKKEAEELELTGKDKKPPQLIVQCGGRTGKYTVGATTYGVPRRYLRKAGGGPVFLIDAALVTDLEGAEHRLMQRSLLTLELKDVERIVVKAYEQERKLRHRNRHQPARAQWVDEADPERRNELYGNWLDRFRRLTVQEYLPVDAKPGSDLKPKDGAKPKSEQVLEVEYLDDDGDTMDRLQLVRVDAEPTQYYAKTNTTRSWVKVIRSAAQQIEDDARPVVGLEPVERPPEAPTPPSASPAQSSPAPAPGSASGPANRPNPAKAPAKRPPAPPRPTKTKAIGPAATKRPTKAPTPSPAGGGASSAPSTP